MKLPEDILKKIDELFPLAEERAAATACIALIGPRFINVGREQLTRSILVLSEGNLDRLKDIIGEEFREDPRDLIMAAEAKLGNPGHYFIPPFDEMDQNPTP